MLQFEASTTFAAWLAQCPLDSRCLTHSLSRTGDGLLYVKCEWQVSPSSAAVAASPAFAHDQSSREADPPQMNTTLLTEPAIAPHSAASSEVVATGDGTENSNDGTENANTAEDGGGDAAEVTAQMRTTICAWIALQLYINSSPSANSRWMGFITADCSSTGWQLAPEVGLRSSKLQPPFE